MIQRSQSRKQNFFLCSMFYRNSIFLFLWIEIIKKIVIYFRLLTGNPVKTLNDALTAIQSFHDMGCNTVVLSSAQFTSDGQQLQSVASTISGNLHILINFTVSVSDSSLLSKSI